MEKSHYRKWFKRVSGDAISEGIGTEDGFTIKDTVDDINNLVFINEKKPVTRQRFTLAHELGHIFMDHLYGTNYTLLLNSDYSEDGEHAALENEANAFARNLLAPAKAVLNVFDKNGIRPILRNGFKFTRARIIRCYLLQIWFQRYLAFQSRLRRLESTALILICI